MRQESAQTRRRARKNQEEGNGRRKKKRKTPQDAAFLSIGTIVLIFRKKTVE